MARETMLSHQAQGVTDSGLGPGPSSRLLLELLGRKCFLLLEAGCKCGVTRDYLGLHEEVRA